MSSEMHHFRTAEATRFPLSRLFWHTGTLAAALHSEIQRESQLPICEPSRSMRRWWGVASIVWSVPPAMWWVPAAGVKDVDHWENGTAKSVTRIEGDFSLDHRGTRALNHKYTSAAFDSVKCVYACLMNSRCRPSSLYAFCCQTVDAKLHARLASNLASFCTLPSTHVFSFSSSKAGYGRRQCQLPSG